MVAHCTEKSSLIRKTTLLLGRGTLIAGLFLIVSPAIPAQNSESPVVTIAGGKVLDVAQLPQGEQVAPSNAGRPPRAPSAPEIVARGVPIELALEVAKVVVTSCAGFQVGVVILDQAGLPKLYYVPDDTSGAHANTAFRKASTALLIKGPSEGLNARVKADPTIAEKFRADQDSDGKNKTYANLTGGMPIVVNGEVIGAIGVSGATPGSKNVECIAAGLKAIQSRLK